MTDSPPIIAMLIEGATLAAILVIIALLLSRLSSDIAGRSLLAILLFAATGAYLGFAVLGRSLLGVGPIWMLIELVQVIVFGVITLRGLRGSVYWLAAGWALHPIWDFALHYIGPGRSFAPLGYVIACVSFDLLVAVYIIVAYGLIGSRRLGFRGAGV